MAIIVRAGAGEACCIMGLIHIKDLWQEKGGHTLILSTGNQQVGISSGWATWTDQTLQGVKARERPGRGLLRDLT